MQPIQVTDLDPSEYSAYFQQYIDLVGEGSFLELFESQKQKLIRFFDGISDETAKTVHEPYRWSTAQVLGHVIDTEKIFGCRAHRIACGDPTDLPGFDQDLLVDNYDYSQTKLDQLVEEFTGLRTTNQAFFRRLNDQAWSRRGVCDQKQISVRAIAFLLIGHANHHFEILKKRLAAD